MSYEIHHAASVSYVGSREYDGGVCLGGSGVQIGGGAGHLHDLHVETWKTCLLVSRGFFETATLPGLHARLSSRPRLRGLGRARLRVARVPRLLRRWLLRGALKRTDAELTATAGYGGSALTGNASSAGAVCYPNNESVSIYGDLGYAEVVQVGLHSDSELLAGLKVWFNTFLLLPKQNTSSPNVWGREDIFDMGPDYRAMVGVPGGLDGPHGATVRAANSAVHNMFLQKGQGAKDKDTLGLNEVWVIDSNVQRFRQAELCLQFHNNQTSTYPPSYHSLRTAFLADGRLKETRCPPNYVC